VVAAARLDVSRRRCASSNAVAACTSSRSTSCHPGAVKYFEEKGFKIPANLKG